jgi:ABC-2 type transport system permease protein
VVCFALLLAGDPPVLDFIRGWAPPSITDAVSSFSFMTRFESVAKGVVDLRDLIFFGSLIGVCLAMTGVVLEAKRAE